MPWTPVRLGARHFGSSPTLPWPLLLSSQDLSPALTSWLALWNPPSAAWHLPVSLDICPSCSCPFGDSTPMRVGSFMTQAPKSHLAARWCPQIPSLDGLQHPPQFSCSPLIAQGDTKAGKRHRPPAVRGKARTDSVYASIKSEATEGPSVWVSNTRHPTCSSAGILQLQKESPPHLRPPCSFPFSPASLQHPHCPRPCLCPLPLSPSSTFSESIFEDSVYTLSPPPSSTCCPFSLGYTLQGCVLQSPACTASRPGSESPHEYWSLNTEDSLVSFSTSYAWNHCFVPASFALFMLGSVTHVMCLTMAFLFSPGQHSTPEICHNWQSHVTVTGHFFPWPIIWHSVDLPLSILFKPHLPLVEVRCMRDCFALGWIPRIWDRGGAQKLCGECKNVYLTKLPGSLGHFSNLASPLTSAGRLSITATPKIIICLVAEGLPCGGQCAKCMCHLTKLSQGRWPSCPNLQRLAV